MKIAAYHLPPGIEVRSHDILTFGGVGVEVPGMTATTLSDLVNRLLETQQSYLAHQPVERLLEICDEAVARWLRPDHPARRLAEEALPEITGFSKPMVARALDGMLGSLRADRLRNLLRDELGDPRYLDAFLPRLSGRSKALGPRLITHVLSGNIPALSATGIVCGLLVKSSILAKVSSREPLFAGLFAQTLADVEPELSGCLAVVSWKGGSPEAGSLEDIALRRADVVVAMGSDETMTSVKKRLIAASGTRYLGYGHRVSFGLIGRESLGDLSGIAERAALDVALFDQQGCLSPHVYYVESGGRHTPREFARALGESLKRLERKLPRGKVSTRTSAALHHFRSLYEMRQADGLPIAIYGSETGNLWTVIYEADLEFSLSPLFRTVRVKPIDDFDRVIPLLSDWRPFLQAAGVAVSPDRLEPLSEKLANAGVNRICPVGRMQTPPAGWHSDGRLAFGELVRWVDLEEEKD